MRRIVTAGIVIFAVALPGCATMFDGTTQNVLLQSNPPGATVVYGKYRAVTPCLLALDRHTPTVTLSAPGQDPVQIDLERHFNGDYLWNVGLGLLFLPAGVIGLTVDAIDGAVVKYDSQYTIDVNRGYSAPSPQPVRRSQPADSAAAEAFNRRRLRGGKPDYGDDALSGYDR